MRSYGVAVLLSTFVLLSACNQGDNGTDGSENVLCPPQSEKPSEGESCGDDGMQCTFGKVCCCGSCSGDTVCSCDDGEWNCEPSGACDNVGAICPDIPGAVDAGEFNFSIPDGEVFVVPETSTAPNGDETSD